MRLPATDTLLYVGRARGVVFPAAETYGIELEPDDEDVERLLSVTPADVSAAPELTFSRNVFLPLTTACRYTCTY